MEGDIMADWSEFKVSGVTENTPKNIMLGAGTLYKGLTFSETKWSGTIIGATSGGSKLSIVPEVYDIPVDGVLVKAKGITQKVGETASIETNMVEVTKDYVKSTVIGKDGTSADTRFDVIESKPHIEEGDYITNFGYVGFMTDGTPIIIILTMHFALLDSAQRVRTKKQRYSLRHLSVMQTCLKVIQIHCHIIFM